MKLRAVWFLLPFVVFVLPTRPAQAKVIVAPLTPHRPPVGFAFPPSDRSVTVSVRDERSDKSFIAGALVGKAAEKDKGVYLAYATAKDDDLAAFMQAAAGDALATLGIKVGDGARLEIVVKDFRVDMYRLSGFSPMNCMGYALLGVTLTGPDGAELKKADLKVAYYDNKVPVGSMKEITEKALSRIYTFAAWQATAQTMIDAFGLAPTPEALQVLMQKVDAEKDEDRAREVVFWLGLTGRGADAVKQKLLQLFSKSEAQKVHQTAAEAMGLLGIPDARAEISEILAGKKKVGGWDVEDNEQVWYLLHALALMGESDLASRRPTGKLRMPTKIDDLIRFHEKGELPVQSAVVQQKIETARKDLKKQRT